MDEKGNMPYSLIGQMHNEMTQNAHGNRGKFLNSMSQNALDALQLVIKKTQDYATIDDPYRNFRMSESVGVSVEKGILVRMCDKLSRIGNLIENSDPNVKGESIDDTLIDIMNYSNILMCYIQEKRNTYNK